MSTVNPPSRPQQIRTFLEQNKLRAWLAWRPDELVMLTGYLPAWGVSVLIYFANAEPLLFIPLLEPKDHLPQGVRVRTYPWGDIKCADPYSILLAAVADELKKSGIEPHEVGMNLSSARSTMPINSAENPPEDFASLFLQLASGGNAQSRAGFAALYLRKTSKEVDCIRLVNKVANIGLRAFFDNLQPGVSEAEVAAAVESVIHRQIGHDGIFYSRGWAMVQSGPNSAEGGQFNRSTGRRLQNGDLVLIELATCVNGYWSDLTRTRAVGALPSDAAELLALVTNAQRAAVEGVGPAVTAALVDSLARNKIAAQGFDKYFTHHTGHHVGFRYHDPGFLIFPNEPSKLEPGMIVTIEPGAYIPGRYGARIEDNVLVTEDGHEVLSHVSGDRQ
jgi:Xaa-Pro dipeptidase